MLVGKYMVLAAVVRINQPACTEYSQTICTKRLLSNASVTDCHPKTQNY